MKGKGDQSFPKMFAFSHRSCTFATTYHLVPPVREPSLRLVASILSMNRGVPSATGCNTHGFHYVPTAAQGTSRGRL